MADEKPLYSADQVEKIMTEAGCYPGAKITLVPTDGSGLRFTGIVVWRNPKIQRDIDVTCGDLGRPWSVNCNGREGAFPTTAPQPETED